jgi:hypothetical protein
MGQYFNKTYNLATDYSDLFNNSILLPDSNVFVQGMDINLDGSYPITFTKVNQYNGDTIWHKKHGLPFVDKYARSLGRSQIVYGNYIYSCANYYDTNSVTKPVLFKLNLNGNIIWEKHFVDTVQDYWVFHSICVANDGNIILAGGKKITSTNYNFSLVKIDTSGNVIWEKSFGSSNLETAYTVDTTVDGGFFISGYREISPTAVDGYIVKTDSMGNFQWQKLMNNNTAVWGRTLSNGNLLVYGGVENSGPSTTDAYVAIVDDTSNSILNSRNFILSDTNYNMFFDVVQIQNNLYFTGGCGLHNINNIGGVFFKSNLFLDSLIFRSYYAVPSENGLYSLISLSDGGFLMTGFVAPSISMGTTQDGWIVRVDSTGCESLSCVLSVDDAEGKNINEVLVYPNPAQNNFTVKTNTTDDFDLTIYDGTGKLLENINLKSYELQNGYTHSINTFIPGIYFIQLSNEQQQFGIKLVKN